MFRNYNFDLKGVRKKKVRTPFFFFHTAFHTTIANIKNGKSCEKIVKGNSIQELA